MRIKTAIERLPWLTLKPHVQTASLFTRVKKKRKKKWLKKAIWVKKIKNKPEDVCNHSWNKRMLSIISTENRWKVLWDRKDKKKMLIIYNNIGGRRKKQRDKEKKKEICIYRKRMKECLEREVKEKNWEKESWERQQHITYRKLPKGINKVLMVHGFCN